MLERVIFSQPEQYQKWVAVLNQQTQRHPCQSNCHYNKNPQKCCSYWPFLPNYAIGALIEQEPQLKNQVGLSLFTSLGAMPTAEFQQKFYQQGGHFLGRADEGLVCPYYEKGFCKVWSHRGAVCQGFFCQSSASPGAENFWGNYQDLSYKMEMGLSQLVALYMGVPLTVVEGELDCLNLKGQAPTKNFRFFNDKSQAFEFYVEASHYFIKNQKSLCQQVVKEYQVKVKALQLELEQFQNLN